MAPNSRSPYPCPQVQRSGRHGEREGEKQDRFSCFVAQSLLCRNQFCQFNRPSSPVALPGQHKKITDETIGPPAPFSLVTSLLNPSRFASPMHGSYFCGPTKLLTSSADWVTVSSFNTAYPVPKSFSQSISQSISQSVSQWQAGQGSFLIHFDPHPQALHFLGVLLVHVPRFSSTGTSTQDGHGPPCQRTGHWVAPLAAAPLGYLHQLPARPDQNSCLLPVPSGQARRARQPALPAAAERSNKGGNALTVTRSPAMTS